MARCHGEAMPQYEDLRRLTHQFSGFMMLHACLDAPSIMRHSRTNLETGEEDGAGPPPGAPLGTPPDVPEASKR